MQIIGDFAIQVLDHSCFHEFVEYLNDHISDNGAGGTSYFQPLARADSSFPPDKAAAFRDSLSIPVGAAGWRRAWVARLANAQIIGHIDLRAHPEPYTEHRCLLGMGVDRKYRKLGLGTRLIAQAEEWALANTDMDWIDLKVLSANEPAIKLYCASGFTKIGEVPEMFRMDGQFLSFTSMTKKLSGR